MEQELLCIDGKFTPDQVEFFARYKVTLVQDGKLYTLRKIVNHVSKSTGPEIGFLLEEIHNPEVPTYHPVIPNYKMEPTFSYKRFAHLNGTPLSVEEIKEWDRQYELFKNLNF